MEKIFLRPYIMPWDGITEAGYDPKGSYKDVTWSYITGQESNSLHLEYSYNEKNWFSLYGNNGVFFSPLGSRQIKNPHLVRQADGSVLLYAQDAWIAGMSVIFTTNDLIHYHDGHLVPTSSVPEAVWQTGVLPISAEELAGLNAAFGKPEPVEITETEIPVIEVSAGDTINLPDKIDVTYSNGSIEQEHVTWENFADMSVAGSYEVKGTIRRHLYTDPLIYHRADPFIYRHTDGKYYFTASHTDMEHNLDGKYQYRNVALRCADSLEGLADGSGNYTERIVFAREPLPGDFSPHIWAPEIHYINGKWYIYFTTSIDPNNLWSIRPHVLECADENPMTGNWVNLGPVQKTTEDSIAFTDFSLDHSVLQLNGELYLFWAEKHPVVSDIYAAKMVNPWTIDSSRIALIAHPEFTWEVHGFSVCEGPGFLHRNGRIFMTYSASGTDSLYCLGLMTIDENADILEPSNWKKSPFPVFASYRESQQFGPGHNSFTTDEEGHDIFVFHSRQKEHYLCDPGYEPLYDAGRNACLTRLHWNPDGTPNFGVPEPVGPARDVLTEVKAKIIVK